MWGRCLRVWYKGLKVGTVAPTKYEVFWFV